MSELTSWMRTSDNVPADGEYILFHMVNWFEPAIYYGEVYSDGVRLMVHDDSWAEAYPFRESVDYWMRIPELPKKIRRKATAKMLTYARNISEWVGEKLPESDDFEEIRGYISRNKGCYQEQIRELNLRYDVEIESSHSNWGDRN